MSSGIWYEVAIAEYLNEVFKQGQGARIVLSDGGSYEDTVLGRDAILCLPGSHKAVPVDFTTDDRRKRNLVFLLDKRWFKGDGRDLVVAPSKVISRPDGLLAVQNDVQNVFAHWFNVANTNLPKVDYPT